MGLFKRKTSVKKLAKKTNAKFLTDWNNRLDGAVKMAEKIAEGGGSTIIIHDKILRCEHNKNRKQEDILNDIKKRFTGCVVILNSLAGRTTVEVRWND